MDDRIFDISKPNRTAPGASGRPIIVGHHPTMADPMIAPQANEPTTEPQGTDYSGQMEAVPMPQEPPKESAFPSYTSAATPSSLPPVDPSISHGFIENNKPVETPLAPPIADIQSFMRPDQPETPPSWESDDHSKVTPAPVGHRTKNKSKKAPWIVAAILVVLAGAYLAIDAGVFGSSINLPFHIFSQDEQVLDFPASSSSTQDSSANTSQTTLPTGYTNYNLAGTSLSIALPSAWGTPTVVPEMGYSKRGGANKADSTYAYIINFATNKDVQIALTSAKYLPPARAVFYYDFLQWCTGTADSKFYKQSLRFTTTAGIDTPATVVCDQGPLTDATKVNDTTIVQTGVKAADGSALGDIYTRNLKIADLPAMRVKDATGKNGDDIKKVLDNLTLTSSAQTQ